MTRGIRAIAVMAVFLLAGLGSAVAAPLTTDQASRFIESMSDTIALGQQLEEEGVTGTFQQDYDFQEGQPFEPLTFGLEQLRQASPSGFQRMTAIARDYGFSSVENWGQIGNRVMAAYVALRVPPGSFEMMQGMSDDMMAMMPPEAQANIRKAMAMAKVIQAVPQADRDAVAPVADRFDEIMGEAVASSPVGGIPSLQGMPQ